MAIQCISCDRCGLVRSWPGELPVYEALDGTTFTLDDNCVRLVEIDLEVKLKPMDKMKLEAILKRQYEVRFGK